MANETLISELLQYWRLLRQQGRTVTPQELCEDCPELATELNKQIQEIARAESSGDQEISHTEISAGGASGPREPAPPPPIIVPGYEILSELGRGGMGVVYKARQSGLNRIVALKMILAGSHAAMEQISRFRREAEAVARLQHPNIVQIYEIGEHGGLPFFSLEFIPGGTLARHLNSTPQPPPKAAQWLTVLARAVQVAHQQGIVHRDLKPGNILLTAEGGLKITDFGLAKEIDRDPGAGSQTQTGAVMGTPSYMAPEQASGKSKLIGPAADIYALGAILYEMLTGRPPFKAASPMDTLMQVLADDPVPPRRLQGKVPVDLETICLKCLAKDSSKRYADAGALADDLERFLKGQPILARPTSWWERSWKWVRRRPAAAALLAVTFLATLLLVVGGWIVNVRLQAERNLAQRRLLQALAAVDRMLTRVSEDKDLLANEPHMEPVRQKLLEDALGFYQELLQDESSDPRLRHETAKAFFRVGKIRYLLGRFAQAKEAYEQSLEFLGNLAREFPDRSSSYQKDRARAFHALGLTLRELSSLDQAEKAYLRSRDLYQTLREQSPGAADYRQGLAQTYNDLGNLLQDNVNSLGRPQEAKEAHEQALAIREKLAADFPKVPDYQKDLSQSYHNVAFHLYLAHQLDQAEKIYRKAIVIRRQLAQEFPKVPLYRQFLGRTLLNLAEVVRRHPSSPEAAETYKEIVSLRKQLLAEFPTVTKYQDELAQVYYSRSNWFTNIKKMDKAMADIDRAQELYQKLVKGHPEVPAYSKKLALAFNDRGVIRWRSLDISGAIADYSQAIRFDPKLTLAYNNRGLALLSTLEYDKAFQDFDAAIKTNPKDADAVNNRGYVYLFQGKLDPALADFDAAIRLNPTIPLFYRNRSSAYRKKGQSDKAQADLDYAKTLEAKKKAASSGLEPIRKGDWTLVSRANGQILIKKRGVQSPFRIGS